MDVTLLRWPDQDDERIRLASAGAPRLLLVDAVGPLPALGDELEDWIRMPADELDLHSRMETLERRAASRRPPPPIVDDDGVLRRGGAWVSLPPVEARIGAALVARYGRVARREELSAVAWPDGGAGRNALDVHVLRLRRRIEPLGLGIRTVRGRGYVLEASSMMPSHPC